MYVLLIDNMLLILRVFNRNLEKFQPSLALQLLLLRVLLFFFSHWKVEQLNSSVRIVPDRELIWEKTKTEIAAEKFFSKKQR